MAISGVSAYLGYSYYGNTNSGNHSITSEKSNQAVSDQVKKPESAPHRRNVRPVKTASIRTDPMKMYLLKRHSMYPLPHLVQQCVHTKQNM